MKKLFIGLACYILVSVSFAQIIPISTDDVAYGHRGAALDPVGDINSDGFPDYIAGAWLTDALGNNAGRVFIMSGKDQSVIRSIDSPSPQAEGWFGYAVASGFDLNADGKNDVVIGAPGEDGGAAGSGKVYVFNGATGSLLYSLVSPSPIANGRFGNAVLIQNDVDANGAKEIVVGAYQETGSSIAAAGQVHVFNENTFRNTIVSGNPEEYGAFGWRLTSADNFLSTSTLIVSAIFENPAASPANSGAIYAFNMTNVSSPLLTMKQAGSPLVFGNFGYSITSYHASGTGVSEILIEDVNGNINVIHGDGSQGFAGYAGGTSVASGNFNNNAQPDFATVNSIMPDVGSSSKPTGIAIGGFGFGYFLYEGGVGDAIAVIGDADNDGTDDIIVFATSAAASIMQLNSSHMLSINSLTPSSGVGGTSITISGKLFSPTPTGNLVFFNGQNATVLANTDSTIVAVVPAYATTGPVTVNRQGVTATSSSNFTVLAPNDSLVLVSLYNSMGGTGWVNKTNWLTGLMSTWFGVTVSAGRVTQLVLPSNGLTGPIPANLSQLTSLFNLDLHGNSLSGSIPVLLFSVPNLVDVDLSQANLTGSVPSTVKRYFHSLNLSSNKLTALPDLTGALPPMPLNVLYNYLDFNSLQLNANVFGLQFNSQNLLPVGDTVNTILGGTYSTTFNAGGTGTKYKWYKNFFLIPGDTLTTRQVLNAKPSDAGTFYAVATNPAVPGVNLQTTNFISVVQSPTASEDSGYKFWKKLGAEALGLKQIKPGFRAEIDNLGNYYIGGTQIQKIDPSGNLLFTLNTGNNDGGLDIAVDSQNSLYTSGSNYSTLKKFNSSGTLVFETPVYGGSRPFQTITIAPDGSILAMDNSGGVSGRIKRFDSATGNLIEQISLTGGPVNYVVYDFDVDASGNIYVPDGTNKRIDKYSPVGVFISSVDISMLSGWGAFILQVADNGHLYVAPWLSGFTTYNSTNKIYHFDDTGVLLNSFDFDFTNISLTSLSITTSNELIVGSYDAIFKFDLNGNFLGFSEPRDANGQFSDAADVAIDSKGFRYVVDRYNNRIQKLATNGNWVSNLGTQGSGAGQFNRPGSIVIDKLDNLYVTDDSNNRVQKFSSSGTHVLTIGSAGTGNGQFSSPVAITISKTGDILVADKGNSRIQIFKADGTFVSAFGTAGTGQGQFTDLQDLVVESDGGILTADGQARLQRFTIQGTFISELNMYGAVTGIPKVATDVDGFLYIPTGGVVKKFDKDGGHVTDIGLPTTSTFADGELRSVSVSSNVVGDTLWIADKITTNRISIFTSNFKKASALDSLALVALYDSTNGASWTTKTNWLTGTVNTWYGVTMSGGKIRKLDLQNNNVDGPLPASLVSLDNLLTLNLMSNKLTGSLPNWSATSAITDLDLSQNLFTGAASTLPAQTEKLDLSDNQLTDVATLPPFIIGADLSNNKLTQLGNLPSTYLNLDTLFVQNNKLSFEDLEPNISIPAFTYAPQDTVSAYETYLKQLGESQTFTSAIGGTANSYQWKKIGTDIPETNADLTLANITFNDDAVYTFTSTNSLVPGLTLSSAKKILRVSSLKRDSIALRTMFNTTDGPNWTNKTNWLTTPLGTGNWFGITISNNRVTQVNLPNNNLKGPIAAIVADIQNLVSLNLSNNKITSLPDLTSYPSISTLNVSQNKLDFASLEQNAVILGINYANQADLGTPLDTLVNVGEAMKFKLTTGGTTNSYQWKRNGQTVAGATAHTYELTAIGRNNMGDYICEVTNPSVPGLTLKSTLQRAKAVANISGKLQVNANTPVTKGKMTLLKINPAGIAFDSVQVKNVNTDGSYSLQKVVLDDYILLGQADSVAYKEYFPTYFDGTPFWEEADTIRLNENVTDLNYSILALPTEKPKGVGELSGIFETELPGGRMENRGRVSGASATVRRQTNIGRPDHVQAAGAVVAFVYTNEEGEFNFENLEEDTYLLNLQYPGVPMDPKSDIAITIGPKDKRQNIQKVEAVAVGGKIVVRRLVVVGVSGEERETVQIYPNPTSSDLYINLTEGSGAADMKLFDRTGREVLTKSLPEGKTAINLSGLSPGIYLIKTYRHGQEVSAARVMVE